MVQSEMDLSKIPTSPEPVQDIDRFIKMVRDARLDLRRWHSGPMDVNVVTVGHAKLLFDGMTGKFVGTLPND